MLAGALGIVTVFWHDWIEALTGWDPDHHNGSAEWLIVAVLLAVAVAMGTVSRRHWKLRLQAAAASAHRRREADSLQNIQVTYDTSTNNARSESSIAINPNNPNQIVAASKKFADIYTYDFTLATEYSTDGGQTWHASPALALPAGATVMTDPTLAWDDSNNVFLVGLTGYNPPTWNTIGIVIYKSSDGGPTWSAAQPHPQQPGR